MRDVSPNAFRGFAAVAAVGALSCVRGLAVEGAKCPCPTGYSCEAGRCVPAGARQVYVGDELVAGFSASGRYLVTLGAPVTMRTGPLGSVEVHDLEAGGDPIKLGVTTDLGSVWISHAVDAVVAPGWGWTPELGVQQVAERPLLSSADGRFLVTSGRFFETEDTAPPTYLELEQTARLTGPSAFVREVMLRPPHTPLLEFSPDGSFLYMLERADGADAGARPRLTRIPTDAALPVQTFEADAILAVDPGGLAPSLFAYGANGTVAFNAPGGVWTWRPQAELPSLVLADGPGPARLVGAGGDWAYVELGTQESIGHRRTLGLVHQVPLGGGNRSPLLGTDVATGIQALSPAPDARVAVLARRSVGRDLVDLEQGTIVKAIPSCGHCFSDRFQLRFSPDSRWLFGAVGRLDAGGEELWLGDVLVLDTRSGLLRVLATQGAAHDPIPVEGDRLAFVRMVDGSLFATPKASLGRGDLVVAPLGAGAPVTVARDVDEHIAVRGKQVAFTRHGGDAAGVYLLDLP